MTYLSLVWYVRPWRKEPLYKDRPFQGTTLPGLFQLEPVGLCFPTGGSIIQSTLISVKVEIELPSWIDNCPACTSSFEAGNLNELNFKFQVLPGPASKIINPSEFEVTILSGPPSS